ncbi:UBA/UAS domain-containing protein Ucp10 [Schizosaccharomyces japonicus yFS275]|uniref:UBA/UAS domain-containing protein Ucp10 n=1 Tax=Schizosaccharomyces japonicus (strain yFS275 / FY16936) TaxID=402676 RepID=B6JYC5_SCHJY|nr:UBA/UAS domain-containing protein Ucp10 [Schizosaccharomyces japonicus yFS275]EEB06543.1 UBA/UAS domain-containing protein Ucp10 [Schizosaccharomyces japonicus yFS275]
MSLQTHESAIRELQRVCEVPDDTAEALLSSCDWDVQRAIETISSTSERPKDNKTSSKTFRFGVLQTLFSLFVSGMQRLFAFLSRVPLVNNFLPFLQQKKRITSPADASNAFIQRLEEQYGTAHIKLYDNGGYKEALVQAKKEYGIALLLFTSSEHESADVFASKVLMNPELHTFLLRHKIICWAGDVCEEEAYFAACQFGCGHFPAAVLTIYSPRHSDLLVTASMSGVLSAESLMTTITNAFVRYLPPLERLHNSLAEQNAARELRAEQDRAYNESLAADRKRQTQARLQRERELAMQRQKRETEAKDRAFRSYIRSQWIEPATPSASDTARISIRLPDGNRVIRVFSKSALIRELYDYADAYYYKETDAQASVDEDEEYLRNFNVKTYPYEHSCRVYTLMPRVLLDPSTVIESNKYIYPNGNVVVEFADEEDDSEEEEDDATN